ncbi:MAG: M6 family metalloprotease domain-containing protein, partial [Nitrospirae bacterium]|nr:M6 family metalloprotease domain-containing protein [Nitrospirota bacterium]
MIERKYLMFAALVVIAVVSCLILPFKAYAVPAAPVTHTLSQPDGSFFEARQWGDENINGWETQEGYTIVFDKDLNFWTYADHDTDGSLISSGMIVGKDIIHSLSKNLRPKDEALAGIVFKRHSKELKISEKAEEVSETAEFVVPPTGTGYVPTILINFNDRTTTYTTGNFNTLLFGAGNYSMKDYYQEVSYSVFSVSAGPGGVVGWYTAANGHNYYGYSNGFTRAAMLAKEAVTSADGGFNFAPYDQDGDCYVDVANIIHQGSGTEASGDNTDIWSHRWSFAGAGIGIYTTNDACPAGGFIKINDYVIQPEILYGQIQTMGVFAHEYGHALGLPDLYDTDGSSEGIGNWSLMAGGSWNYVTRSGDRPAHMDAWSKYKLGWVTPTQVIGTLTNESITQAATTADVYKMLNGTPDIGEYFLVENRQKTGFDAGLPGAGLLIWHIDASIPTNQNECYPGGPPCSTQHYKVALVQADNLWEMEKNIDRGDTGDPYPGSTNNTSFNSSSSPNSNLYNGSLSNASVTSISASASTMTATLSVTGLNPDLIVQSISTNPVSPYQGQNVNVTVTVKNQGGAAAGAFWLEIYKHRD